MIRAVIEEHALEAATLYGLRDVAVAAPDRDLDDLGDFDERLEANLDALRIGGAAAARLCQRALDASTDGDPGELFVAAVLAFESRDEARVRLVLDAVCALPGSAPAAAGALGWLSRERAEVVFRGLAGSRIPALRRVGIEAAAMHGVDLGGPLLAALASSDTALRASALGIAGRLGLVGLAEGVKVELEAEEVECRFAAATSASLLGAGDAAEPAFRVFGEGDGPLAEAAMRIAGGAIPMPRARAWARELLAGGNARSGIVLAGSAGDPALLGDLLEVARTPELARLAAESITMITGVRMAADLSTEPPPSFRAGPSDDPDETAVAPDPDHGLAWPNLDGIVALLARRPALDEREPHLLGRPRSDQAWLESVLARGRQRERAEASRARARFAPGGAAFDVTARAPFQRSALAALAVARSG